MFSFFSLLWHSSLIFRIGSQLTSCWIPTGKRATVSYSWSSSDCIGNQPLSTLISVVSFLEWDRNLSKNGVSTNVISTGYWVNSHLFVYWSRKKDMAFMPSIILYPWFCASRKPLNLWLKTSSLSDVLGCVVEIRVDRCCIRCIMYLCINFCFIFLLCFLFFIWICSFGDITEEQ